MDELDKRFDELNQRLDRLESYMDETIVAVRNSKTFEEMLDALQRLDEKWAKLGQRLLETYGLFFSPYTIVIKTHPNMKNKIIGGIYNDDIINDISSNCGWWITSAYSD